MTTPDRTTASTYLKLMLTALIWGGTWIAARVAVREAAPLTVAAWRFLLAALALGVPMLRRHGMPRWSPGDWLLLALLGLTGIFLYNVCFLYGLRQVEAGRGALVAAFIPALIALADRLLLRQPMPVRKAIGVALALGGCLLVISNGQPLELLHGRIGYGETLLLGTALAWTVYTLVSRRLGQRFSPLAMTFGASLTGCLMLAGAALAEGSLFAVAQLTWRGYAGIAFLGLLGTAVGFTWYSQAIAVLGSTRAAAFINLVPVCAVLLGALLLGERLGSAVLAGGSLVIVGVLLTNVVPQAPGRRT